MKISEPAGIHQMKNEDFRKYGHELVDKIADYFQNIENYSVMPTVQPGDIFDALPPAAPLNPEPMESILHDFDEIIMPGIMHWNSPSFHGYFPANNSYPSVLAEMLTAGIGAQCMMWQTSPAATELEEKLMIWLRDIMGLPDTFTGVIQDTASTATLIALLTARERASNYNINETGFSSNKFRIYCSEEAHSSIEKAVKIAGFGRNNLVKIQTDHKFSVRCDLLEETIIHDRKNGFIPLVIVGAFGTTGSLAIDAINDMAEIAQKYDCWLHVDAAYLGAVLLLPEYRSLAIGLDRVDSIVFNPHKWLMTNFDCSAYYVRDKESLIRTFEIMPEYLKTAHDNHVNNYRDWGIQLGRRFRALKLWFVMRTYGVEGLKNKIAGDIALGKHALAQLSLNEQIEILAPADFNVICFRFNDGMHSEYELNELNAKLLNMINHTGNVFLTHTKLKGKYAIRIVIAQTNVEFKHVDKLTEIINSSIKQLATK
jgi:aromatic-L-amino-acid decarboxylase